MERDFSRATEEIFKKDQRYRPESYGFVMESFFFTQKKFKKNTHVTGRQFAEGLKYYCFEKFGPLSKMVLNHWGITTTRDVGEIVFNLINAGLMSKTEEDSVDDFNSIYDFEEAFEREYKTHLDKELREHHSQK